MKNLWDIEKEVWVTVLLAAIGFLFNIFLLTR
jgi:hypothetical protein